MATSACSARLGDNPNRIEEFVEMLQRNVMDGIICCADILSSVSLAEIHRPDCHD